MHVKKCFAIAVLRIHKIIEYTPISMVLTRKWINITLQILVFFGVDCGGLPDYCEDKTHQMVT